MKSSWQSSVNRCLSTLSPQLSPSYLTEQREPVFRPCHPNCPRVNWQSSVNRCFDPVTPTVPELPDRAPWTGVSTLSPQLSQSYLTEHREPVFVHPVTPTVPELPDRAPWTGVCQPYHPNCPRVTWQSTVNRCLSTLSPQLSPSYLTEHREPVFVHPVIPTNPELPDRAAWTGVCRVPDSLDFRGTRNRDRGRRNCACAGSQYSTWRRSFAWLWLLTSQSSFACQSSSRRQREAPSVSNSSKPSPSHIFNGGHMDGLMEGSIRSWPWYFIVLVQWKPVATSRRVASRRVASRRVASRRVASRRVASRRVASRRVAFARTLIIQTTNSNLFCHTLMRSYLILVHWYLKSLYMCKYKSWKVNILWRVY